MKRLAILFALFILVIIVLADTGILSRYMGSLFDAIPNVDKLGHFLLYGVLALFLNLTLFRSHQDRSRSRLAAICGLILALLIGLAEVSQQYFSSRTFDLVDLTFSYLGVLCFSVAALVMKKQDET